MFSLNIYMLLFLYLLKIICNNYLVKSYLELKVKNARFILKIHNTNGNLIAIDLNFYLRISE